MARYLNPSALVAVRHLASEAMRARRPRRAARVRHYVPEPSAFRVPVAVPALDVLGAVLDGLRRLEVLA
ncbi:hypothetical protein [Nocardiopsis tropica]|uniref:Uncharacterized protein n=1 Tax=Nocardiopsis tropica TaxID=109330 RepID=A0ABV2A4V5_9ACTN